MRILLYYLKFRVYIGYYLSHYFWPLSLGCLCYANIYCFTCNCFLVYLLTYFLLLIQVTYGTLDPLHLIEWMELQQLLGVGMVGVYNLSIDEGPAAEVNSYEHQNYHCIYTVVLQSIFFCIYNVSQYSILPYHSHYKRSYLYGREGKINVVFYFYMYFWVVGWVVFHHFQVLFLFIFLYLSGSLLRANFNIVFFCFILLLFLANKFLLIRLLLLKIIFKY